MTLRNIKKLWCCLWGFIFFANPLNAQQLVTPSEVLQQLLVIENLFNATLSDECPDDLCYSKGCQIISFATLETAPDRSLPGLDSTQPTPPPSQARYNLQRARCEYTYEASLQNEAAIKKRLTQKVARGNVSLQILSKKLDAVPEVRTPEIQPIVHEDKKPPSFEEVMMPFLPFFAGLVLVGVFLIIMLYGFRTFGRRKETESSSQNTSTSLTTTQAEPSPLMLLERMQQLQQKMTKDTTSTEAFLQKMLEEKKWRELCFFMKHFGTQFFHPFKQKTEFFKPLEELSQAYGQFQSDVSAQELWSFFDELERAITSAEIRIHQDSVSKEFAFLGALTVEQLVLLLKDATETEAIAAITHAPNKLREEFFAVAPPQFTTKLVEKLTTLERITDSFARQSARKLKGLYQQKFDQLQTTLVDRTLMLESALNHMDAGERKKILVDMQKDNPSMLKSLTEKIFLDESLNSLTEETLTSVFLETSPQEAALYLGNYPWGHEVLERINPKLQQNIKAFWGAKGDINQIITIREKIARFLRHQHSRGLIDLRSINTKLLQQ